MDWDKLRVFHTAANAGSFTRASEVLNISQSAISRQVSILEQTLGAALFVRVPRGLVLTGAGQDLYTTVNGVFAKLEMTQAIIAELKSQPRGHLQVATSLTFGSLWLAPRLQGFLDQYPDIRLTLLLKEEGAELNMRKVDIGMTTTIPSVGGIIHHTLLSYTPQLYASRTYLDTHGVPQAPEDLDQHRLIVFGKEMPHLYSNLEWSLTIGAQKPRTPYLVINNYQAIFEAVRAGFGIAALPHYVVGNAPDIIPVLPHSVGPEVSLYFVYLPHLEGLKRIDVFMTYLFKKVKEEGF
jgi:DNA-binding transcriptional LysR family regulator